MQTFLPYADFEKSVACLDRVRLNSQRNEAKAIIRALTYVNKGYRNHAATNMWRGYLPALRAYYNCVRDEWLRRGYKTKSRPCRPPEKYELPPWFGDPKFHNWHKSKLAAKKPEHYQKLWPSIPKDLPEFWPTKNGY